jgi:hypothetical protein
LICFHIQASNPISKEFIIKIWKKLFFKSLYISSFLSINFEFNFFEAQASFFNFNLFSSSIGHFQNHIKRTFFSSISSITPESNHPL